MPSNKVSSQFWLNFLVFVVIISIFFVTAWSTGLLTSGFRYFIDDHQIPLMYQDLNEIGYFETLEKWIQYDRNLGRFRPFFQIHVVTLTKIFGLNSTLWFAYITLLGSLTTFFLFWFGRLLNFSIPISLIFAVSILLGWQSEIWLRPLIPDAYGMFFLSAALVFLGLNLKSNNNRYSLLFIISVFLMSLCKESYIIFIPSLIFLNALLFSRFKQVSLVQAFIQTKITSLALILILGIELIYILFFLGTSGTGYAGVDESSFRVRSILLAVFTFFQHSLLEIAFLGLLAFVILRKIRHESVLNLFRELPYFLILLLLALIPQTLLYAKSGITAGFYLFPAIVVSSLFLAESFNLISQRSRWLGLLLIVLTSIVLLGKIPGVLTTNSTIARDSRYINEMFEQVKACTNADQRILAVVNPRVRYEVADAFQRVLRVSAGRNDLLLATYGLEKTHFYSTLLEEAEKQAMFLDPQAMDRNYQNKTILDLDLKSKQEIKAIVIFDDLDAEFAATNKSWFNPQAYQLSAFDVSFAPVNLYCKKPL